MDREVKAIGKTGNGRLEIRVGGSSGPTILWNPDSGAALSRITLPCSEVAKHQVSKRDPTNPKARAKIRLEHKQKVPGGEPLSTTFEFVASDIQRRFDGRDTFKDTVHPLTISGPPPPSCASSGTPHPLHSYPPWTKPP